MTRYEVLHNKEGSVLARFDSNNPESVYEAYCVIYQHLKKKSIPPALFLAHVRVLENFGLELNNKDRRALDKTESLMLVEAIDKMFKREGLDRILTDGD